MATKIRIGARCHNPHVPNEVWDLFKKELRKVFKLAFPEQTFSITEFYWRDFPTCNEYIKIIPKEKGKLDWKKVWDVLSFTANEFGMAIQFLYHRTSGSIFELFQEESLIDRDESRYSLVSTRKWTIPDLDAFLASYSFETLKEKYEEAFEQNNQG